MALTAGSSSSGCGVSTPTRKWTNVIAGLAAAIHPPLKYSDERPWIRGLSPRPRMTVRASSALLAQAHDHVDARDLVTLGHFRQLRKRQMRVGNVDQLVIVL